MKRRYEQSDTFQAKHVVDAVLSPDAAFAVYELSETVPGATPDEDAQPSSLWCVDLGGGEPRRLTSAGDDARLPQLSPDGGWLWFLRTAADVDEPAQVYRLSLSAGKAEQVTAMRLGVVTYRLSSDGNWIAFAAADGTVRCGDPAGHVRIDRFAYRFDGVPGYLQERGQAIYAMSTFDGEAAALTAHDGLVRELVWSPESREIAAVVCGTRAQSTNPLLGELRVLNRTGRSETLIGAARIANVFWTLDGAHIGFIGALGTDFTRDVQLMVIDRVAGTIVDRTAGLKPQVGSIHGTNPATFAKPRLQPTSEGFVIAPMIVGGESSLYEIALWGEQSCDPVISGSRCSQVMDRAGDVLLFLSQDACTPSELRVASLALAQERALTSLNAHWHSDIAWPDVERLQIASAPDVEIEGWVLKPAGSRGRLRTILFIHGGPHAAAGNTLNEHLLEMVGTGYAVAFANPRGSAGYGEAFSRAIVGRWGEREAEDLLAFVDALVERGIADPERLGVAGSSYGGYLCAWLIAHTNRFKAAVAEQGIYNLLSVYGVADIGVDYYEAEMGGPPHEQFARYWQHSPVAHAHRCKTPTLLIQGENDLRCPMEQAEELYATLKRNGCEVELLRLADCSHGSAAFGRPALRRFRMDAMTDWFARHIPQ